MCPTCPCNSSSFPGVGDVAGDVASAVVGAAISKPGRKVMFWGVAVPMLPFAIWGELHWWTLAVVALAAVLTAAGVAFGRILHRGVVQSRPELTPQMRAALAARGLRPIPAPGQQARPALPRGLSITRKLAGARQASWKIIRPGHAGVRQLPAPAKAIEGVVLEEPAIGWENVPAAYKRVAR